MTGTTCPDCGVMPGTPHEDGCDIAHCLHTGRQRIGCDTLTAVFGYPESQPHGDCGRQAWTGCWPGVAECAEFGWYSFFESPGRGWVRCAEGGHPEAAEDLSRLLLGARWDRAACRWRRPGDPVDDTFYVHWHLKRGFTLEPSAMYTLDGATLPATGLLARIISR